MRELRAAGEREGWQIGEKKKRRKKLAVSQDGGFFSFFVSF